MQDTVTCPRCSAVHHRTARFCPSCGLDYIAIAEARAEPKRRRWSGLEIALGLLILLVVVGGVGYVMLANMTDQILSGDRGAPSR